MANESKPKNVKSDKKHRKLTKSPQVSCDLNEQLLTSSVSTATIFLPTKSTITTNNTSIISQISTNLVYTYADDPTTVVAATAAATETGTSNENHPTEKSSFASSASLLSTALVQTHLYAKNQSNNNFYYGHGQQQNQLDALASSSVNQKFILQNNNINYLARIQQYQKQSFDERKSKESAMSLSASPNQNPELNYPLIQECIDDVPNRKLHYYTPTPVTIPTCCLRSQFKLQQEQQQRELQLQQQQSLNQYHQQNDEQKLQNTTRTINQIFSPSSSLPNPNILNEFNLSKNMNQMTTTQQTQHAQRTAMTSSISPTNLNNTLKENIFHSDPKHQFYQQQQQAHQLQQKQPLQQLHNNNPFFTAINDSMDHYGKNTVTTSSLTKIKTPESLKTGDSIKESGSINSIEENFIDINNSTENSIAVSPSPYQNTLQPFLYTSNNSNNPFLSDNIKRDEFLKSTMKICLVVSPPSNKLLQVRNFPFSFHYFSFLFFSFY